MRLLSRLRSQSQQAGKIAPSIRVRPDLNLDYAHADIAEITKHESDNQYEILTTFMGLYGVSSPLPSFYTEELLDLQWEEEHASREFLDIIHYHLYPLLYSAWSKYQFAHQAIEHKNDLYWNLLFSLFGLGDAKLTGKIQDRTKLLPYLGIYTQQPRSALGLKTILCHFLNSESIDIKPCVPRKVAIPEAQKISLGQSAHCLGETAHIGGYVEDRSGKFLITIGPISGDEFQRFINNKDQQTVLKQLIDFYLVQPLEYAIELIFDTRQIAKSCLGEARWGALGRDAWLAHDQKSQLITYQLSLE